MLVTAPLPASADSIRTTSRIMLLAAACGSIPEQERGLTGYPCGLRPGPGVTSARALKSAGGGAGEMGGTKVDVYSL